MKNKIIALSVGLLLVIIIGFILIRYFDANTKDMVKNAVSWIFYTIVALITISIFVFIFPKLKHIF